VGIVIFLVFVAALGAGAYLAWRAKQRRREESHAWAVQHDLEFSAADPFGIPMVYPFHLFTLGDGRGCQNVMSGAWQGLPVKEADYWYYTESSDSRGSRTKTYHHFSVVVADLECFLPRVSVQKESLSSMVAGHLGFHDLEVESEPFNRLFRVKAEHREFAYQLLDARMIRWLESTGGTFGFEVSGQNLLVWSRRRKPTALIPLFGCARLFCDHIPRLVWNEYGTWPARPDASMAGPEERSTT
jgi:hypothetical protein